MNSIVIMTVCNIINGVCLSMPIQPGLSIAECAPVISQFNTEQRNKVNIDQIRIMASCVPENEFPMEYFNIKQASYDK